MTSRKDPKPFIPKWNVLSEVPEGTTKNWEYAAEGGPLRYCVVAGWYYFQQIEFIDKCRVGGNHGFRTAKEIDSLIQKLIVHGKYNEKKDREVKQRGGKRFKVIPQEMQSLKKDAEDIGKVTSNWSLLYDEQLNPKLRKKKVKKGEVTFIEMEPIDHSYEILADLHVSMGHCSGMALHNYLKTNNLYAWPRELVNKFPMYCIQCRRKHIEDQLSKMLVEERKQSKLDNVKKKEKVEDNKPAKKVSIVRQGSLSCVKLWNFEEHLILSSLDSWSSLITNLVIPTLTANDIYGSLLSLFSNAMFPKKIFLEIDDGTTKFLENDDVQGLVSVSISQVVLRTLNLQCIIIHYHKVGEVTRKVTDIVPDFKISTVKELNEKKLALSRDCFGTS